MTDWVRLWHDMPTDPKWRTIARKSGQPLPCVIALFNLLMVNASANAEDRGTLRNWENEDAAAALDMDVEAVCAVIDAMQGKVLDGERLTGWERRQPRREDNSANRVKLYRERKVTHGNACADSETQGNATVTQCNAPETETETETDTEKPSLTLPPGEGKVKKKSKRRKVGPVVYTPEFEAWWSVYPRKEAKSYAQEAYDRAKERIGEGAQKTLIDAALEYSKRVAGREARYTAQPTTWLNQGRWEDEPTTAAPSHLSGRNKFGIGG